MSKAEEVKKALKEILYFYDGVRLCKFSSQPNWKGQPSALEKFMGEQTSLWASVINRNSNGKLNHQNIVKEVAEFLESEYCLQEFGNLYTDIDIEIDVRDKDNNIKTQIYPLKDIKLTPKNAVTTELALRLLEYLMMMAVGKDVNKMKDLYNAWTTALEREKELKPSAHLERYDQVATNFSLYWRGEFGKIREWNGPLDAIGAFRNLALTRRFGEKIVNVLAWFPQVDTYPGDQPLDYSIATSEERIKTERPSLLFTVTKSNANPPLLDGWKRDISPGMVETSDKTHRLFIYTSKPIAEGEREESRTVVQTTKPIPLELLEREIRAVRKGPHGGQKNLIWSGNEMNTQNINEILLSLRSRFFPHTFCQLVSGYFDDNDSEPVEQSMMEIPYMTENHEEWLKMLNSFLDDDD